MIKIKSKKGITIISLVITIIIMLILTTTILYKVNSSNTVIAYNNMLSDIELLEDKILMYFNTYGEIPKTDREIEIESIKYYEIDLSKLDNITLNYGKDYKKEGTLTENSNVYTVNDSLQVYFLKGATLSGEVYHEN